MRNFLKGIKNFWKFRSEIYNFRNYDYIFTLKILKKALEEQREGMEMYRHPEESPTNISDAIESLDKIINEDFYRLAEENLNLKLIFKFNRDTSDTSSNRVFGPAEGTEAEDNRKIFDEGNRMEEEAWKRFFTSLVGDTENEGKIGKESKGIRNWWY